MIGKGGLASTAASGQREGQMPVCSLDLAEPWLRKLLFNAQIIAALTKGNRSENFHRVAKRMFPFPPHAVWA